MPPAVPAIAQHHDWYLGIDLGTTGISAVLLHQQRCQLYPIYWADPQTASDGSIAGRKLRLPAIASIDDLALQDWKPFLHLGVPYKVAEGWEPIIPWSDSRSIPLQQLVQATQGLLSLLSPAIVDGGFFPEHRENRLSPKALGLEPAEWQTAVETLSGVILTCPTAATEAYRRNLSTALLGTQLITKPQQIHFVEEAIAALLSTLCSSDGRRPTGQQLDLQLDTQQGNTVILSAGASVTELAIVSIAADPAHLTAADFLIRSLPYAGTAIDQDILCQLIYPALAATLDPTALWLAPFADLTLPKAGEPDPLNRERLRQRLNTTPTGQALQQAARTLKLMFQQKSQFTVRLGDWQQPFLRQDVGSQVLLPYIQRLNRELNSLLAQANLSVMEVNQVICTGGTASLGAIARWLRQKLPNATITQDTYRTSPDNCIPNCSRTAYGLATLPLHPQMMGVGGRSL
ncbi:hypothetical protein IFO70_14885 [Phormidium tenue FACHB-886]|nr:hypothetical protein [Phormidium tenue FACHB-886]